MLGQFPAAAAAAATATANSWVQHELQDRLAAEARALRGEDQVGDGEAGSLESGRRGVAYQRGGRGELGVELGGEEGELGASEGGDVEGV